MSLTHRCLLYVLVLYLLSPTCGHLQKRDTSSLKTLNIPLKIDANRRYVAGVNMSSGLIQQSLGLAVATSTGYTTVAGVGCSSCNGVPKYNQSASSSAKPLTNDQAAGLAAVQLFNGSVSGNVIKEDCALHQSSGASWKYPNQTIIVANVSSEALSPDTSGIFGLGTNINSGNFSDTVFGGFFSRNPTKSNFTFGMALSPPTVGSSDGGTLHWLAPDSSAYQGQVSWMNVVTTNSNSSSIISDWVVQMNGWSFKSGGNGSSISTNGSAVIDPYYPDIYLPQSQAQTIYAGVGGASMQSSSANTESWIVPCSAQMKFVVQINSFSVPLDEKDLIINNGNICTGVIQGLTDPNESQSILGGVFISKLYLIFAVLPNGQNSIGFSSRAMGHPLSSGSIAAIALGCFIAFAALAVGSFLLYRRNVNRTSPPVVKYSPGGLEGPVVSSRASQGAVSHQDNMYSFGTVRTSMVGEEEALRGSMYHIIKHPDHLPSGHHPRDRPFSDISDVPSDRTFSGDATMSVERNPDYVSSRHTASAIDLVHSPPILSSGSNLAAQPFVSTPGQSRSPMSALEEKRRLRMQAEVPRVTDNRSSSLVSATSVVDEESQYQSMAGLHSALPEYSP